MKRSLKEKQRNLISIIVFKNISKISGKYITLFEVIYQLKRRHAQLWPLKLRKCGRQVNEVNSTLFWVLRSILEHYIIVLDKF